MKNNRSRTWLALIVVVVIVIVVTGWDDVTRGFMDAMGD